MKYKVTLNGKTYEVEVEAGQAMLVDEYEAYAPAPAAAPAAAGTALRRLDRRLNFPFGLFHGRVQLRLVGLVLLVELV